MSEQTPKQINRREFLRKAAQVAKDVGGLFINAGAGSQLAADAILTARLKLIPGMNQSKEVEDFNVGSRAFRRMFFGGVLFSAISDLVEEKLSEEEPDP